MKTDAANLYSFKSTFRKHVIPIIPILIQSAGAPEPQKCTGVHVCTKHKPDAHH